jgi:hypothetical protein
VSPGVVFAVNHATSQARRKGVWGALRLAGAARCKKGSESQIGSNRLQDGLRNGTHFWEPRIRAPSADPINVRLHGFESHVLRQSANVLILRYLLGVIRFGALPRHRSRRI